MSALSGPVDRKTFSEEFGSSVQLDSKVDLEGWSTRIFAVQAILN